MKVWVTRAQPAAAETAARLIGLGCEAVVSPLIAVRPLNPALDLSGVGALAFTSANGVRAFAERSAERGLPVFAVGAATGGAARAQGFSRVMSSNSDVAGLAELIVREGPGLAGEVLHAGAAEPAGDLASALKAQGLACRSIAVYESYETPPTEALARWEEIEAVLLHSPRAARALAGLARQRPAPGMAALCISPTAAQPLAGVPLRGVAFAAFPNETALLQLLQQLLP